jgi:hypothetical protein
VILLSIISIGKVQNDNASNSNAQQSLLSSNATVIATVLALATLGSMTNKK